MPLTTEDRLAITDLISLHGHYADTGELDRMTELFTEDVVYDVTAAGGGLIEGRAALKQAGLDLGDRNPLAHHVTNVVVTAGDGDSARAVSKAIAVLPDHRCASATYEDTVVRDGGRWLISHRTIRPRREPLTP
ncbi:nuclear transport factor 2 family protein [Actinomadura montaniterrae]|uniref:Nuclear transport factor 2 family protein n=1 Tax=Actinomadura montaniterrae TaxID=1803903 RepID=A0A6L3VR51_9ACTN|nr:nuclear transport factor 2 family protein [Actinomadura montaniterrae]KAB2379082.1 nuclear transport factor 2 family protein [Actinomadura montaniterrae]